MAGCAAESVPRACAWLHRAPIARSAFVLPRKLKLAARPRTLLEALVRHRHCDWVATVSMLDSNT
jgi:hypothetical protein